MNRLVRRACGLGILAASFVLAGLVIHYQPAIERAIRSIGPFAYPIAVAVFTLVAAAPFSMTDALAIMNGSIFGPFWGSVINAVGIVLASMLGYWINLRAQHLLDLPQAMERLPAWVTRFKAGSPAFLIAVRIIPGLGGTVATATAAAYRVPIWVQVWTMSVVAIPICVALAIFGNGVTAFVHRAETRAHTYIMHHRPHFHLHIRHKHS